ncbi:uncharacterized protein LOC123320535 [Coccinella septempunctata]|uniref:uncharacterized protein LOC123320535 n=1 Tax=Coccinella septempunctata TaxID=41139 RepID=UPI001D07C831|nr:uncharacterized protein LOC123320535 [Coccinella septempunctata]XP_044763820.1 uncharacterized protein LOC123320535 [Coccinella septempunctata]
MVKDDLTVLVIFPNKERLHVDDQIVSSLPEDVYAYLKSVEKWPLSVGTQIENQRKDVKELLLDMKCIKECNKIFDVNHVESSERNSMIERVAIVSRKNGLYLSVRRVVR